MTHLARLGLAALALLPPSTAASTPQGSGLAGAEGNLDELVAEEVQAVEGRAVGEVLARVFELRGADRLGAGDELDRALDRALSHPDTLSARAKLFVGAARLLGEDPELGRIAAVLAQGLSAPDDELAAAMAGLLADPSFRGMPRSERVDLAERLLAAAEDPERSPELRMQLARGVYNVGVDGAARSAARAVLREFLGSADPELRAEAALALAASADQPIEGQIRMELERMQRMPDARGQLASVLLKEERLREHFERKLRDLRSQEPTAVPSELSEFRAVLHMVEDRHLEGSKVQDRELVSAGIDGMLQSMDPHSSYLPSEAYASFFQDLEAEYGGIGAYVNTDPDTGLFTIVQPIYSGPAYRAGLKTDDKIVRVDDWPTVGKDRDEIIKRLKGKPDTSVDLYVWRRGMDPELIDRPTEDMVVTVERALVEIPAGTWQLLPGGVGLIELNTFSRVAMEELESWIPNMLDNGMRALILDMRRNSGGLLDEAREVVELFLGRDKVVVTTEGRDRREALRTRTGPVVPADMPVVILTSRLTASAAEIVSGALQDHGRAKLVGKQTFGKGSVQQLLPVDGAAEDEWRDEDGNGRWDPWEPITVDHDGDGEVDYAPRVKLTVARYLLPSGRSIHRELDAEGNLISEGGVSPDVVVDFPPVERWQFEEERRVRASGRIEEYVDARWEENREVFAQLALNDGRDPSLYPGFDRLMAELGTTLPRDDVRRVVREEIRRRVQDDRGVAFPWGDFVEDVQVQEAIRVALEELGEEPGDVGAFGLVFDFQAAESGPSRLAALRDSAEIRRLRVIVEEARAGKGALDREDLDEVLSILDDIDH